MGLALAIETKAGYDLALGLKERRVAGALPEQTWARADLEIMVLCRSINTSSRY